MESISHLDSVGLAPSGIPGCLPQGPLQEKVMEATGETLWRIFCVRPPLGKLAFQMAGAHRKSRLLPASIIILAVSEGFEPPLHVTANLFSRQAPSATRTTHH